MTLPALEMRNHWRVVKVSLAGILTLLAAIPKMLEYIVMVSVSSGLHAGVMHEVQDSESIAIQLVFQLDASYRDD